MLTNSNVKLKKIGLVDHSEVIINVCLIPKWVYTFIDDARAPDASIGAWLVVWSLGISEMVSWAHDEML